MLYEYSLIDIFFNVNVGTTLAGRPYRKILFECSARDEKNTKRSMIERCKNFPDTNIMTNVEIEDKDRSESMIIVVTKALLRKFDDVIHHSDSFWLLFAMMLDLQLSSSQYPAYGLSSGTMLS